MNKWRNQCKKATIITLAVMLACVIMDMSAYVVHATQNSSITSLEEQNVIEEGTCGENLTWKVTLNEDGTTHTLTITGSGEMEAYPDDNVAPWYDNYRNSISNVILPDGLTNIGNSAFYGCTGITTITIPEGVTKIEDWAFLESGLMSINIPDGVITIGKGAFQNCNSLTSATIPDSVISTDAYVFSGCFNLTSVTLSKNLTVISDMMFRMCFKLASITIPASVTSIGSNAFESCSSLTEVTIPNGVTTIGDRAFSACSNLIKMSIPSSVTSIGDTVFSSCNGIKAFEVASDNSAYTSVDGVLFTKDKKTLVAFPAAKSSSYIIPDGVTTIGISAFRDGEITDIDIPDSVTVISDTAFFSCQKLDNIEIPDSVTSIGGHAFGYCENLYIHYLGTEEQWNAVSKDNSDLTEVKGVHYVGATPTWTPNEDGTTHSWRCSECDTTLETKEHCDADDDKNTITNDCDLCSGESVTFTLVIPTSAVYGSVKELPTYQCSDDTYAGETPVIRIEDKAPADFVPTVGTYKVTMTWGGQTVSDTYTISPAPVTITAKNYTIAFGDSLPEPYEYEVTGLVNGEILPITVTASCVVADSKTAGKYDIVLTGPAKEGNYTYTYVNGILEVLPVVIGDTVTSDDGSATYKITKTEEMGGTVTYMGPADKKATKVVIPVTVIIQNKIYKVTKISDTAFAGNKAITSVAIGDNVTGFSAKTFKGCTNLKTMIIGKGVKSIPANAFKNFKKLATVKMGTGVKTVGKNAFYGCSKLKNLTIGKNVTTIGDKAFYKCTALTKISLPSKVKTIGKSAFYGCSKVKTLTIKSTKLTTKKIGSKAFSKTPKSMTVKVPKKKYKAYKSLLVKRGVNKKAKFKKF